MTVTPSNHQARAQAASLATRHSGPHALTVDVEDYFQVSAFDAYVDRRNWGHYESRVEANTLRILELFARHNVRGTFFILGWVAHHYPQLVREIHAAGHELGSHSYWHRLVYDLTPEEFLQDLRDSRAAIEDAAGVRVTAYRAPSFSITKKSLWALDLLVAEGFGYDSSLFAVYHDRYGIPDANPCLHRIRTPHGNLWEFPASVLRLARINLPVSGGGYFRLYPVQVTVGFLAHVVRQTAMPLMFYTHPWEIDPEQPRFRFGSRQARFRHYVNLSTTESKLDTLLDRFAFGAMTSAVEAAALRTDAQELAHEFDA